MKKVISDIVGALKSKRVILAVVVAAMVAVNEQLALMDADTLNRLVALAGTLIVGDAIRGTNPDKNAAAAGAK
tara:strand:- start:300 stop:518 length:219 start_codon:yes stop_codon:yes gene_type:complete